VPPSGATPLCLLNPANPSIPQRLLSYESAAEVLYGVDDGSADGGQAAGTALATALSRLLERLLDNLEGKSRAYRGDAALAALFMMNNVHYVQWSAEGGAAEALLGRDWLERHKDLVEDWGARYQDVTWGPLLAMLQARLLGGGGWVPSSSIWPSPCMYVAAS
jgi:hypothetical protein